MNLFKYLTLLFFFFFNQLVFSQIPIGYYNSAEGLSGESLKSALYNIIKGHTEYPYTSSSTDVWDILKESDRDTANPENVILFYSGWSVNAAQEYNNNTGWSREHVWAKSHGDFGTELGAGTDAHHLRPADITVNSARNNKDFDNGGTQYIDGDGPTDCYSDYDSWQPRNAVKRDVARMLFYMATRYEGENGEPDLELVDQVDTDDLDEPGKGYFGKLSTLLQWHKEDPVDSFEIHRNDVVYSYQHNRNPFIDHPEYIEKIWSTATSTKVVQQSERIKIYPNPANEYISIDGIKTESEIIISSSTGHLLLSKKVSDNSSFSISELRPGIYIIQLINLKNTFITKLVVN